MQSCRICFVTDVRMVMLGDTKVKEFLENIFSSHGFTEKLNERHYVCYECKALLHKSYNFIQKALRAQTAIENLQQHKTTDEHTWKSLRDTLGLNSNLSFCNVGITLSIQAEEDELQNEEHDTKSSLVPLLHSNPEKNIDAGYSQFHLCNTFIYPGSNEDVDSNTALDNNVPLETSNPVKHEFYVSVDCIKTEKFEDENYEPNSVKSSYKKQSKAKNTCKKSVLKKEDQKKLTRVDNKDQNPVDMTIPKLSKRKCLKKSSLRKSTSRRRKKYREERRSLDSDSEFSYDEDDDGKRIKRPKEEHRVYPRKCEHCDYIIEAGKFHYYHYVNIHPHEEYPYMRKDRRYVCQFCGIGKKYMSELREHEMIHGGDKPFVCPTCGKSFCNKKQMRAHHARVHIAPRLFCEYCNKGFKEKSVLKLHIRTHTGEKPYKCSICGAGFAHGGNVGVHMRNVHQQDGNKIKSRNKTPKLLPRQEEPLNLLTEKADIIEVPKVT